MAVITIKPKNVVIPFDLTVMLGRKLDKAELDKFNEALKKRDKEQEKEKTK